MVTVGTVKGRRARRLTLAAAMAAALALAGAQAAWADAGDGALAAERVAPGIASREAAADQGAATLSDASAARADFGNGTSVSGTLDYCLLEAETWKGNACTITLLEDTRFRGMDYFGSGVGAFVFDEAASVTLDLNGHTATAERPITFIAGDAARLTVKDSGSGGALVNGPGKGYALFMLGYTSDGSDTAALSIEGGAIDSGASRAAQVDYSCSLTMTSGSVTSSGDCAIGVWGGTVNMSGGSVTAEEGSAGALYLDGRGGNPHASIGGGSLIAQAAHAVRVGTGASLNLSGSPTLSGRLADGSGSCSLYCASGASVTANDGASVPAPYRGEPIATQTSASMAVGETIVSGLDASNANLFPLVGREDGAGAVFDGSALKLAAADDPAVAQLADLRAALGAAPQDAVDLRAVDELRARLAADPRLANQLHLLSEGERATLEERTAALAAIDAFEAAVAALPKATDADARTALDAAQALYAAVPDAYRSDAFVSPVSVAVLADFEKAVAEAEKPAPLPQPDPEPQQPAAPAALAATGDGVPAVPAALLGLAAGTAALAAARRRNA